MVARGKCDVSREKWPVDNPVSLRFLGAEVRTGTWLIMSPSVLYIEKGVYERGFEAEKDRLEERRRRLKELLCCEMSKCRGCLKGFADGRCRNIGVWSVQPAH